MNRQEEIQAVIDEIQSELEDWQKAYPGQTPGTMTVQDGFIIDCTVQAILRFLVAKGIAEDEEELVLAQKQEILRRMREMRPQVDEAQRQLRLNALLPNNGRMDIPKGKMN